MQTQQQKKKNKKLFNLLMIAMIAVIAFCAVMAVGHIRGWFGGDPDSAVVTGEINGVANIERSGVGYSLKEKVPLKAGDIVETESGSTVQTKIDGKNQLTLNENAELSIAKSEKNNVSLALNEGEIFADAKAPGDTFDVALDQNTLHAAKTGDAVTFAASQQQGSTTVSVLRGSLSVGIEDGSEKDVKAGESLLITRDGEGHLTADITELKAESFDDFVLTQAMKSDSSGKLCFTAKELKKVQDTRTAEKEKAQEAAAQEDALYKEIMSSDGSSTSGSVAKSTSGKSGKNGSSSNIKTCTIQIRCDTILKNMSDLKAGKSKYVPANGVILATSKVEFADGETVFDVLKRACSYTGIQLEYSYTPMYGSYYVEGINHLYEFDCGSQSGWMYKVNGWFPNYGCSSYKLKNGDAIVWTYTCKGLGADVGGGM